MDKDSIETSKFLVDFNPLIHKTLQRLHINQNHMDYEDYFQELQIHLLTIRKTYQAPEEETDKETKHFRGARYVTTAVEDVFEVE